MLPPLWWYFYFYYTTTCTFFIFVTRRHFSGASIPARFATLARLMKCLQRVSILFPFIITLFILYPIRSIKAFISDYWSYCSSQPSLVHWLSSPISPFLVFCLSRYGNIRPNLTSSCPTPPNPYIFWKFMIIAIQKWIRNTNTKTKTNTKTMTKTKAPRE